MARIFLEISCLFLISILSFTAHAADLQAFIQEGETTSSPENLVSTTSVSSTSENPLSKTQTPETSEQFTHIIELVVAGIVASALIISVLVLFLGRWAGRREKKIIKKLRIKAEEEQENIIASATTVREQEKETTQIVHKIRDEAKIFSEKKEVIENFDKDVHEITLQAKAKKEVIDEISDTVNENVGKIKSYWDEQLTATIDTIDKVQTGLDKSLISVDKNLDDMLQQKIQSDELLSQFMNKNNEQLDVINENSISSDELNKNLKDTLKESTQLLKMLKKHQKSAEKSLNKFTEELIAYEEQAYEQFDTSFQVADLARQELNANIDESRKHIETMRRHEEQSHSINTQTQKNLKSLDFTKITKLSHTLDSTFSMFHDMTDKVDETRAMLDELSDLKADISINKGVDDMTLNTQPSQKTQLAKKMDVKLESTPTPLQNTSSLNVDLKKPTIKAKTNTKKAPLEPQTTEVKTINKAEPFKAPLDDIITTKKDQVEIIKPVKKEPSAKKESSAKIEPLENKEPSASKGPSAKKKPSAEKQRSAKEELPKKEKQSPATIQKTTAKKKPLMANVNPLEKNKPLSNKQQASILSKKAPKNKTLKEMATTPKEDIVTAANNQKTVSTPKMSKPITIKSRGTAKPIKAMPSKANPITKTKENSISNVIEEQVEIKSVLDSSDASKTAFKMANADNVPVSFFKNVKKNQPLKTDEKKEPILDSVKRTFFGSK